MSGPGTRTLANTQRVHPIQDYILGIFTKFLHWISGLKQIPDALESRPQTMLLYWFEFIHLLRSSSNSYFFHILVYGFH